MRLELCIYFIIKGKKKGKVIVKTDNNAKMIQIRKEMLGLLWDLGK